MFNFQELPVTITGRIRFEEDFIFKKSKEDLAVKIRSVHLPNIRDLIKGNKVYFDNDGDIVVKGDAGTSYTTKRSVIFVPKPQMTATIVEQDTVGLISGVLQALMEARSPLRPEYYHIRFVFEIKDVVLNAEQSQHYYPEGARRLIDDFDRLDPKQSSIRWDVEWIEKHFINTFEFTAQNDEINLVWARGCDAKKFPSYGEFASASDIPGILRNVHDFIEPLVDDR